MNVLEFIESIYHRIIGSNDSSWSVQNQWIMGLYVFLGTIAILVLKSWYDGRKLNRLLDELQKVGGITLDELERYSGRDPFLPLLLSVRGTIFDVSKGKDFYGPGGGYEVFAGKEVARALAIMSLKAEDCTDNLEGVTEKQMGTLKEWEDKFRVKYPVVGEVVPPLELTLEELKKFNGTDKSLPIYLAIKGTVFDVSKGRQFYGPEGIYPFAGYEVARAFALLSTDTKDCVADTEGLDKMEMDNLRDWQEKFHTKYKLVGKIVSKKD